MEKMRSKEGEHAYKPCRSQCQKPDLNSDSLVTTGFSLCPGRGKEVPAQNPSIRECCLQAPITQ